MNGLLTGLAGSRLWTAFVVGSGLACVGVAPSVGRAQTAEAPGPARAAQPADAAQGVAPGSVAVTLPLPKPSSSPAAVPSGEGERRAAAAESSAPAPAVVAAQPQPVAPPLMPVPETVIDSDGETSSKAGAAKPHPLQAAAPGYNVIVCDGGCRGGQTAVVAKESKSAARVLPEDFKEGPIRAGRKGECAGGCYVRHVGTMETGITVVPMTGAGDFTSAAASEDSQWLTTTTAAPESVPAPASVPAPVPVARSKREDWMSRINRERAASKASQPATN